MLFEGGGVRRACGLAQPGRPGRAGRARPGRAGRAEPVGRAGWTNVARIIGAHVIWVRLSFCHLGSIVPVSFGVNCAGVNFYNLRQAVSGVVF